MHTMKCRLSSLKATSSEHIEGRGTQPSFGAVEGVTGAVLQAVVSKLSFKNEYLLDEEEEGV